MRKGRQGFLIEGLELNIEKLILKIGLGAVVFPRS